MSALFKIVVLLLAITSISIDTFSADSKKKIKSAVKVDKYTTDSIEGIYIPKDLDDCFKQIDIFWTDSVKQWVRTQTEKEFNASVHFGFGRWIRNNWQLWGGSRLSSYFREMGITHPDAMSGIILTSYYRYLNNKEIKLSEQLQEDKNYWEILRKKQVELTESEFSEFVIGDTVIFNYRKGFISKKQESDYDKDICCATGILLEKNGVDHLIKVRLIESCSKKGIIVYNNQSIIYNPKTGKYKKQRQTIRKFMMINESLWFDYNDWSCL